MIPYYDIIGNNSETRLAVTEIQAGDRACTTTIKWYKRKTTGDYKDDSKREKTTFEGAYAAGSVTGYTSKESLSIITFYKSKGKEYGVGYLMNKDGTAAYVFLVRP